MDALTTPTPLVQTTAATGPKAPVPAPKAAAISSDFETFLKMLTVQMQNQDPTNPIESSDYAVQLATFSGVEQQVRTNQLLERLTGQGSGALTQLAAWIGQEARSTAPVWMDGKPVSFAPDAAAGADRAVLVVRNAQGSLVTREDVSLGNADHVWLGADAAGNALPAGRYGLTLESWSGETLLGSTPVAAYAEVIEVRASATGGSVILTGGIEVESAAVTALRQP